MSMGSVATFAHGWENTQHWMFTLSLFVQFIKCLAMIYISRFSVNKSKTNDELVLRSSSAYEAKDWYSILLNIGLQLFIYALRG